MIAAPPPHDIGPRSRQGSPGRGSCGAPSKPLGNNDLVAAAAGRRVCVRKRGFPKSLPPPPKKPQHLYPPQSAPVNTSRLVPRGHQASNATTATKRLTVIPTPSPIREGVSYLAATKFFIPQLPAPPLMGADVTSAHQRVDDNTKTEKDANQDDPNLVKEAAAKEETWSTQDEMLFYMSFVLDRLLMLLCAFTLLIRPYQIIMTVALSVFIWGTLMKWEAQNTIWTGLSLIVRCISSYVTSPPYRIFIGLPEKAFASLLVVAALIEILHYKLHEKREGEEEQRMEQEKSRLVQLRLQEQELKKKQQEEARRKRELEMLWRMAQQNTLIRERVEEINYGGSSSNTVIRYSSVNNHDDKKRRYHTQDEAEDVIARMREQGLDTCRTLKSYYNPEYDRWFVGNGW